MWLLQGAWVLAVLAVLADSSPTASPPDKASIFADLSATELRAVRTFLMSRPELGLSPSRGGPLAKNTLFLVELLPPKKELALRYLDQGGPRPRRQARAVVFFGGQTEPNITEFAVGPLPQPSFYRPLRFKGGRTIPFAARPMTQLEYELLHHTLAEATEPLYRLLRDSTGFWFHNCSRRCLTFSDIAPRGLAPGERRSWLVLQRFVEGFFLHPVGLEVLVDHQDPDPRRWTVQQLWYNGQYFSSPQELAERYEQGTLEVAQLEEPPSRQLFSSYEPRGRFTTGTPTEVHGAKVCEPQGRRYWLRGNRLEYGGWSLAFRLRSSAGLQLFDLRFNGERLAYEVSVQEAIAFYGGHTPAAMQTKYMDAGWGMGSVTYELARGIDCPEVATYLDAHHLYDADGPVRFSSAICIFELPTGVPLRRHFDSDFQGGFNFYAGLEGQALVLRTTSTVYNYDYIWDFLLYSNGVMEAKVHATGFIHATFYTPQGRRYGSRVHSHVLGNLHTHLVHYKVDLDIAGPGDSPGTWGGRDGGSLGLAAPTGASGGVSAVPHAPPMATVPSAQDLVAWVTVGFLHVPHAEDIPNTATPGNAVGFFLRPFNFFDEDPSVASRSTVIVRPLDPPTFSQLEIQRWTPASPGPCGAPGPFTYNG
ncbi:AOC1 oxidase, partial [Burhinus bistriatus]|nr:AOC1 oxidase [Burhinus bistriatus]